MTKASEGEYGKGIYGDKNSMVNHIIGTYDNVEKAVKKMIEEMNASKSPIKSKNCFVKSKVSNEAIEKGESYEIIQTSKRRVATCNWSLSVAKS